MNVTKISQKIKSKSLLSTGKYITDWEEMPYYKKQWLKKFF